MRPARPSSTALTRSSPPQLPNLTLALQGKGWMFNRSTVRLWGAWWRGVLGSGRAAGARPGGLYVAVVFVLAVAPVAATASSDLPWGGAVVDDGAAGYRTVVLLGGSAGGLAAVGDDLAGGSTGSSDSVERACGPWRDNSSSLCWVELTGFFVQVSAGGEHSCGLRDDGIIRCWGSNKYGQANPPEGSFSQVSAGGEHSCGLRDDGIIRCWGSNRYGQANPPEGSFSQVSAGGEHSCGLRDDGIIRCWGSNRYGQANPPEGSFVQVSAGGEHSCGLRDDGAIRCWNIWAEHTPTPEGSFIQVSAGVGYWCGLRAVGAAECWGGVYIDPTAAVLVVDPDGVDRVPSPPEGPFTHLSAGGAQACGLRDDGTVECWGFYYVDGWGTVAVVGSPPGGSFIQVSAGEGLTCGVRADGSALCWGVSSIVSVLGPSYSGDAGVHQPSVDALHQRFPGIFEGTGCWEGLCPQEPLQRWEIESPRVCRRVFYLTPATWAGACSRW